MKCSYFETLRNEGKLPQAFTRKYGNSPEQYYVTVPALNARYGAETVKQLPWPGIGLYTYLNERIGVGLKQLLAGSRKFKLDLIDRADLSALSERASKVTEIPLLESLDLDQIKLILN
jgi:hypothetical protein